MASTIAPPPAPPPSAPYCWDLPLPELNHLHYPNTVNWTVPADCKLHDGSTTPACYRDCDYFAGFDETDLALQDAETHARRFRPPHHSPKCDEPLAWMDGTNASTQCGGCSLECVVGIAAAIAICVTLSCLLGMYLYLRNRSKPPGDIEADDQFDTFGNGNGFEPSLKTPRPSGAGAPAYVFEPSLKTPRPSGAGAPAYVFEPSLKTPRPSGAGAPAYVFEPSLKTPRPSGALQPEEHSAAGARFEPSLTTTRNAIPLSASPQSPQPNTSSPSDRVSEVDAHKELGMLDKCATEPQSNVP
ncbi:hypothetical protein EMIHUDRAFT_230256 [Emiliania huxleyi CCMP1516]|uniref:Uncharacterized protein n=2 Tax=Emiliania huxleyi TaxID=2903 RepID=A0A0D3KAU0_EMIH1|nr:hypothetical protein EMIHUDRAFT_230256 [Emiliania huxleyi CCMP1516]EOD32875.1 hypothetical protein EMIHUDRAFT_230256 [Emiliania huxleyi CCMP1516]|eukprot:XP_005785304.1 hypothetical protein EMIHUDRAFT_230256 [Emiliania huxleyi CCMP1516]